MEGTIRTLDSKMQVDSHERIRLTATKIAEESNATAEVNFYNKTLVTYNTPELVEKMIPSLQTAAGKIMCGQWTGLPVPKILVFTVPKHLLSFFILVVCRVAMMAKNAPPHHTPDFIIDDSQLFVGVKTFVNWYLIIQNCQATKKRELHFEMINNKRILPIKIFLVARHLKNRSALSDLNRNQNNTHETDFIFFNPAPLLFCDSTKQNDT